MNQVPGVQKVGVDLTSRTASVVYVGADKEMVPRLRQAVRKAGYDVMGASEDFETAEALSLLALKHERRTLLWRLLLGVGLSAALLMSERFGFSPYSEILWAVPLQIICGWHFHAGFWRSLRNRRADMDTLVSLSTWAAFLFSAAVVLAPGLFPAEARQPQWDAVAGIIVVITFGRWLEAGLRGRTNEAILKLMRMAPKTVSVLREGAIKSVPIGEVGVGETLRVKPGEQIGLDGTVVSGYSTVDESLLTGEGLPVEKAPGSSVRGGTMNKEGFLEVRVTHAAGDSALSRIVAAVKAAQSTKPRIQKVADYAASIFVPVVLGIAAFSSVAWSLYGPEPRILFALTCVVAVLASACPCALGLATPLAVIAGTGRAAQMGVFIRDADALERIGKLDAVVFDKTGVFTEGRPKVAEVIAFGASKKDVLSLALAAGLRSDHPLSKAAAAYALGQDLEPAAIDSFETRPGRGIVMMAGGKTAKLGSLAWLKEEGCLFPEGEIASGGGAFSVLGVCLHGELKGVLHFIDALRPEAKTAVEELKDMGLEVILASGDRREAVEPIAREVGVSRFFAELLPEEKAEIIETLQAEGKKVAMVGEGFNDAPAISQADIGIALASGTDIAVEVSDMTVMNPDLSVLSRAIALSRSIHRVIWENLGWAFAYNLVLIPVAAGALYPGFGILLKPQYASAAMALSSISVALNSLRLRRKRL